VDPTRSCIACRQKAGPSDLIRLVADPSGVVQVDLRGRLPGRGAWICASQPCVARVCGRPALLSRALRIQVQVDGLPDRLLATSRAALRAGLSLAAKGGCIVSGQQRILDQLTRGSFVALVSAADAAPRSLRAVQKADPELPSFQVYLDRAQLGHQVGKGPRAVLAVRAGAPSRPLVSELHRQASLGYHPAPPRVVTRSEATCGPRTKTSRERGVRRTPSSPDRSSKSARRPSGRPSRRR